MSSSTECEIGAESESDFAEVSIFFRPACIELVQDEGCILLSPKQAKELAEVLARRTGK